MTLVNINKLPPIFPCWNNLRNYLLESNLLNNDVIELKFNSSHRVLKNGSDRSEIWYRFHLDYIKARCYDEFCSLGITANDVFRLDRMCGTTGVRSNEDFETQEKLRSMINLFSNNHFR